MRGAMRNTTLLVHHSHSPYLVECGHGTACGERLTVIVLKEPGSGCETQVEHHLEGCRGAPTAILRVELEAEHALHCMQAQLSHYDA